MSNYLNYGVAVQVLDTIEEYLDKRSYTLFQVQSISLTSVLREVPSGDAMKAIINFGIEIDTFNRLHEPHSVKIIYK